ncbi:SRPBCC family protein [Corynebacterium glyciniphilum]|uniref:SRPBCC family protein n=1 Tax=Corynebacterium glyciniphilum TaxID=1404244 RepID=UPI0011AB7046|nr:SRPBCC family protein [Corynebacterium glyciniphilum]
MPTVSRTFTVSADRNTVVDYLKDFSNAEEWEPGTQTCRRLDDGPVDVGSRWHNTSKLLGISTELVYELTHADRDRLQFIGRNDTATSTDTMTFRDTPDGTEITYTADIAFHGAAKLADLPARLLFEKVGTEIVTKLTDILA